METTPQPPQLQEPIPAPIAAPTLPEKKQKKAKVPKPKKPIQTSGRRKRAIARATLYPGKGVVRVNSRLLTTITPQLAQDRVMEPLILAGPTAQEVDIHVSVNGGGWQGQAEATRLAIGKALAVYNKKLKKVFLDYDRHLLVADIRYKEERKPNDSKARASRQKSYR